MILVMMMMMMMMIIIIIIIRLQTGVHCWDGTRYLMGQVTNAYKMSHKARAITSLHEVESFSVIGMGKC